MRYFFIDLENVRNEGLEGVSTLNSDDMVYIFYSENAFSMAIPTLESITNSKCSSKFIKTNYIGKNAMDFQIVSLFGATIEKCKEGSFYIISRDNGFRSAVSFCESYFGHYSIKCGVFPKIINAVSNELKTAGKKQNSKETEKKQEEIPEKQAADPAEGASKTRSRSRSRKRGGAKQKEAMVLRETEVQEEIVSVSESTDKPEEAEGKKQDKNTHPAAKKYGYIYDILGEILSEKTIEIYAQTIDEGIKTTSSREELQAYFHEQLGDDEGDALFKVVQSDYDIYRQKRVRKPSRPHRSRSKNKARQ